MWKESVLFGVGWKKCSRDSHFSELRASLVPTLTKSGLSFFVLPRCLNTYKAVKYDGMNEIVIKRFLYYLP